VCACVCEQNHKLSLDYIIKTGNNVDQN